MKADFHVHTSNTDCSESPRQVFKTAKENGVTHIAITDHDTLYGQEEHRILAEEFGLTHIPAVEISAYDYENNKACHIVGLNALPGDKDLDIMMKSVTDQRHRNSDAQILRLMALGYDISFDDFIDKRGVHGVYKQHIMDVLRETGYVNDLFGDFYKKMFKNGGPLEMKIEYPSAVEAVKVLRNSGALPVLAHPSLYGNLEILESLIDNGLMGIEAFYPVATEKDREEIFTLAERYGLFISGGSDFHGDYGNHSRFNVGDCYVDNIDFFIRR
ncbi:hypothetical protein SAMN02745751_00304 [Dethiosulfatibacter aminovorans DSM 17477]|uniref:Polymerase/histidinol phosphatase N-terminal domain-containing protein n=1 Tax=Dethiosulfatibacter aminovorans DSM 17477 TaxID=1121476 RepID=A0A1M6B077_9FIRM|nr:phosphatase [Dethiosulfatibacter aminovorans]SHI41873.1 hypothetical protein SAMN02745751_00304 [Dethiosulfatibacter aminovorans DSM 17477]